MKIGGHVSAAGGIDLAIERTLAIGANCLQIFITSPRQWRKTNITDEQVERFRAGIKQHNFEPVFIHGMYLANLASEDPGLLEKSIDAVAHALITADRIGAQGVIYHTGSRKDRDPDEAVEHVIKSMKEVLKRAAGGISQLIIEGSAGQKGAIGSFKELGQMLKGADSDRVKICLDTCHAFAAGHDLVTPTGIKTMLADFDRLIGLEHLVVIHANDSKFGIGEARDRHENIGLGKIGNAGFSSMLQSPELRQLPWLLEVPGDTGEGPDLINIQRLQELAK
jgi:deoxyribonuclease-4